MANPFNRIARPGPVRTLAGASPNGRPNRSIATAPEPGEGQTTAQSTSEVFTYFTKSNGKSVELYRADRLWVNVTLTLETAGPVAIGFKSSIVPVLSGKGILLSTGQPVKLTVAKGNSYLYIASTSINRVKVTIEPLPWLEQIMATLTGIPGSLAKLLVARK